MAGYKCKVSEFNKSQLEIMSQGKNIANFKPGDNIEVHYKQANLTRPAVFAGVCIARKSNGHLSSLVVAKMSGKTQVLRSFLLHSPTMISINVTKTAKRHRRAKLYHLIAKADKS